MKKRILALLGLTSIALVASVVSLDAGQSHKIEEAKSVIDIDSDTGSGPVFYEASYQDTIENEPYYDTQNSLGYKYMGFKQVHNTYRGESVKVAILDSGINYNHEDLYGIVQGNSRFYEWNSSISNWQYYSYSSNPSKLNDSSGHGTNVASVVASQINNIGCAGIAPNVDLYIFKVTNESNSYEWGAIQNALSYCVTLGVKVINMSFQAYESDVEYNGNTMKASSGCSSILSTWIDNCYSNGITLVGAAGNYNTNVKSYPASNNHVISVGSFDKNDKNAKAPYSNYSDIDIVAPGYVQVANKGESNVYKENHGTSFSAPIVTAAIALYKQKNPSATPAQIEAALYASCDPIKGEPDWAGNGALNIDRFLGYTSNEPSYISFTNPNSDTLELNVGDTFQLAYEVSPSGFSGNVEYETYSDEYIRVSSTGLVTALAETNEEIIEIRPIGYPAIRDEIQVVVKPNEYGDYYKNAAGLIGKQLLGKLHDISVENHTTYNSYSNLNTTNFFKTDPYDNSNTKIMDFYTGASVKNSIIDSGSNGWNREHVWPKSLSNGLYGESGPGADIQHLRPTIAKINSDRGSLKYGELNDSGTASTSTDYNGNAVTGGYYNQTTFQPMSNKKGDVARILMYMYMHYNKASNSTIGGTKDGSNSSFFGTLNFLNVINAANETAAIQLLLTWNQADPVDSIERLRNTEAAKITGCRNPFIDHPEYANAIWGNTPISTKALTRIALSGNYRTTFNVGETFTYSGLVVTAHYNGAEDAPVTPTSVSTPDMSTAGEKPITVSYTESGVTKSETYTITVSAVEATSITLNKNSASVKVGNTVTLSVDTWDPTNVTNKTLIWTSSDESVATVDDGVVTAVAPGTATITAKTSNNKTDTCTITVPEPQVTDISLEILSKKVRYTAGSSSSNTFTLTATLDAEAGATVTWTSSNTSVIKVVTGGGAAFAASATEVTGYFETVGTGTSTITATAGGKSATCEVRATLPVKSYRAVANNSSVTYTGSTTSVSCTIYEVYTDNTEAIVNDNYSLSTNASTLGAKTASGTYEGSSVSAPVTVTNNGSSASITTSTDASKQAEAWANYFIEMTTTTSTCKASSDKDKLSGLQAVWGTLANEYGYMASLSKSAFCSSSASDKIKEALNHYQFIISKFNKDGVKLTDFVVNKPASSSRSLMSTMFSFENTGFIVAILSIIGVASIAVFVVYKKRKTY